MAGWIVWLVVAAAFGAAEMLAGSGSFFLAPFAIGAAVAAAAASAAGETAASIVFVAVSIITLMSVRPLVQRRLTSGPGLRTGGAALVGKRAVVAERVANHEGVGKVRIDGELWTARCLDEDCVLEPGTMVHVIEIKGATALVME
ncbi:MAG TPA: NfeD family protein [Solirubrobacteraceae bacterium]|jgi:membrane protein implicated in regulation of membrane protease activity|nr:NfeD family protein [Solirubrobacteraceae bacterium]